MRVVRVTRHLTQRNFSRRGVTRRLTALHYVPTVVTTTINNHNIDPVLVGNMARDLCACEAMSFAGQVAIVMVALQMKNVRRGLRSPGDTGI